jgi:hypothetical protein
VEDVRKHERKRENKGKGEKKQRKGNLKEVNMRGGKRCGKVDMKHIGT